jgi:cyclase
MFGGYDMYTHNGKKNININPIDFAIKMEKEGAGEIVINSIDNDGVMKGYDLDLIDKVRNSISLPLTVLGGAGDLEDIGGLIQKYGIIGAAAGSLFVFKGKYKAVLINYPNWEEKDRLINQHFKIN